MEALGKVTHWKKGLASLQPGVQTGFTGHNPPSEHEASVAIGGTSPSV